MVFCSFRRASLFILFLTLCFTSLPMFVGPVQAETTASTRVYGRVVEGATGRPIPNATVIFLARFRPSGVQRYEYRGLTNASGDYEIEILAEHRIISPDYWAFAFLDNSSTPGFDYVPDLQWISVAEDPLNVSFILLPGASIYMAGDFGPPPPTSSSSWISFTVIDQYGFLDETNAMKKYGYVSGTIYPQGYMSLDYRTVVVPSDTPVKIEAEAYRNELERFTIPGGGRYLNLTQGSLITINLNVIWMVENPDYVPGRLEQVQAMVEEAEGAGFYVSYEKNRLFRTQNLVEAAYQALSQGDYESAYTYSHEAHLIIADVEGALQSMYLNASQSVFFITPFLAFTAVALASLIFENWRRKLTASLILYVTLFGLLYLLYPGYTILQKAYNPWSGTPFEGLFLALLVVPSFLVAHFVILALPVKFKEKTFMERLRLMSAVVSAFSMAARNLKRRRLRTLLTTTFMLISVFAFITLTSLSFEEGFAIKSKSGQVPSEGFLLRNRPLDADYPWYSIEPEVLQWLKMRPEIVLSVPKVENWPSTAVGKAPPIAAIQVPKSGLTFDLYGVLGVYPSLEVNLTKMDTIVAEGQFLKDEDLGGILISQEAAEKLQVGLNDAVVLYNQTFNVTGIFDGGKLDGLRDLDGEPLVPWSVEIIPPAGPGAEPYYISAYVSGGEVVIIHAETAQGLPGMMISRIDVQTRNPEEIMDLARLAVLFWSGFEAFTSVAGKINHLFIGSYQVATGFVEAIVPLALVVLNVGAMMLSAVYERRREIFTMSSVGLNPSHITAVFVAEALVIGIVAGSLGYVLGLASYRLMVVFPATVGVKQKVEATWGILTLCFSIGAAVLGTAIPSLKASIIATPSLLRKWRIKVEEKPRGKGEPWVLSTPIQLREEETEGFFGFMRRSLREYAAYPYSWIENLKVSGRGAATRLSFTYTYKVERSIVTENELFPVKSPPDRYAVKLTSRTRRGTIEAIDEADVWQTADFIRQLILQYSAISTPKR